MARVGPSTSTGARPTPRYTCMPGAKPVPVSVNQSPPFCQPWSGRTAVTAKPQEAACTHAPEQQS